MQAHKLYALLHTSGYTLSAQTEVLSQNAAVETCTVELELELELECTVELELECFRLARSAASSAKQPAAWPTQQGSLAKMHFTLTFVPKCV
jgi:hypothetical protein